MDLRDASYSTMHMGRIEARRAQAGAMAGFTMIELVVTMIVVGILAVAVLPRFSALGAFDAVAYRDKVRATLEHARKSAVAGRRTVTVTLASNSLSLRIDKAPGDETSTGDQELRLPTVDANCGAATNQICPKAGSNVTLSGTASLTFNALGVPGGGASYTITGADSYTVTVEAETGYVH